VVVDTLDKFADIDAKRSEADTWVIREMVDPLYPLLDLGVAMWTQASRHHRIATRTAPRLSATAGSPGDSRPPPN